MLKVRLLHLHACADISDDILVPQLVEQADLLFKLVQRVAVEILVPGSSHHPPMQRVDGMGMALPLGILQFFDGDNIGLVYPAIHHAECAFAQHLPAHTTAA